MTLFSVFILLLVAQFVFVFRKDKNSKKRLFTNLAVGLLNVCLVILIKLPFKNSILSGAILPFWAGPIFLDFIIYWQHRSFHWVPLFWGWHKFHHEDKQVTLSTALRFHSLEILFSYLLKVSFVLAGLVSIESYILYETLLSVGSMFTHTNVQLKSWLPKWFFYIIATPDLHRVHHSVEIDESSRNFGSITPLWDLLFGSFLYKGHEGQKVMSFGAAE